MNSEELVSRDAAAYAGGGEVLVQAPVFPAATRLALPALRKARLSSVMGFTRRIIQERRDQEVARALRA